jgi:preprotein translocase subunit YajC
MTDHNLMQRIDKSSDKLKVGDMIVVAGMYSRVDKVVVNLHDDMVLHLTIINTTNESRSKMMLILPKKVPVATLK